MTGSNNVRFGALCGLKSDAFGGPGSAHGILQSQARRYDRGFGLDLRRERAASHDLIDHLRVTPEAQSHLVDHLSGGNQQKILTARWLNTGADVLIFDEPTQGIDIGTKEAIYALINTITRAGKGVILLSSEDKELLSISDRVVLVRPGRMLALRRLPR